MTISVIQLVCNAQFTRTCMCAQEAVCGATVIVIVLVSLMSLFCPCDEVATCNSLARSPCNTILSHIITIRIAHTEQPRQLS